MRTDQRESWETLTPEMIEGFLKSQREKGASPASLETYRRSLKKLYDYLPEDKRLTVETGQAWKRWMEEQEVSPRSINSRLSALNSLSGYLDRYEFQVRELLKGQAVVQPELTREEYLRLLRAARWKGKEKTYLLIKLFGGAGLRPQELSQLTVESVKAGSMELSYHNGRGQRVVRLPQGLQAELLDYIDRHSLQAGPIFQTSRGEPVSRTYVFKLLRSASHAAHVDEEKATPRCLWNMYCGTRDTILSNISILADQAYDRMLQEEQHAVGWNAG